jgi:uncharacterized membrane protein
MTLLRAVMLLALVVWVGGIIFFAFVLAPTVFRVLPTPELAGNVVSRSLTILHWMGIISALGFLSCSLLYRQAKYARSKPFALVNLLVLIMLVLTLVSQFGIGPRMQILRGQMSRAQSPQDSLRVEFDNLHAWSTRLEGGVLFLGLIVVASTARRFS